MFLSKKSVLFSLMALTGACLYGYSTAVVAMPADVEESEREAQTASEFPLGRFAISDDEGTFFNYGVFTCAGNGIAYCETLNRSRLTKEEAKLADGISEVEGDFEINYDPEAGQYTMSGNLYVMRTCYVSTAKNSSDYGSFAPRECTYNSSARLLKCPMADPYEYSGDGSDITVYLGFDGMNRIFIDNIDFRSNFENNSASCGKALKNVYFNRESKEQYLHSKYLTAKLKFMLADGSINRTWKNASEGQRKALKKKQLAWIKEKDRKCGPVTMKGLEEDLIEMYKCQTAMTEERDRFLAEMLGAL